MNILNDICHAEATHDNIKVTAVEPMSDGKMLVTFSTGEKRMFDISVLRGAAFEPLADEKIFNNPVLHHGVITWDNGAIDIALEAVYQYSHKCESEIVRKISET